MRMVLPTWLPALLLTHGNLVRLFVTANDPDDCATQTALLAANEALHKQQLETIDFAGSADATTCRSESVLEGGETTTATVCDLDYSPVNLPYREACEESAGGRFEEASLGMVCTGRVDANTAIESTYNYSFLPGCVSRVCPEGIHLQDQLKSFDTITKTQEEAFAENYGEGSFACSVSSIDAPIDAPIDADGPIGDTVGGDGNILDASSPSSSISLLVDGTLTATVLPVILLLPMTTG